MAREGGGGGGGMGQGRREREERRKEWSGGKMKKEGEREGKIKHRVCDLYSSVYFCTHGEDKHGVALPCLVVPVLFGEVESGAGDTGRLVGGLGLEGWVIIHRQVIAALLGRPCISIYMARKEFRGKIRIKIYFILLAKQTQWINFDPHNVLPS